ncbi:PadR family transcriptional regulator [Rhodococcus sp. IEGM 1409]|uniref:PadR family transcriptional regulator n=1 Tax=Rhodococcus sp. IEGM 1409 TaxID=3047082 RepID=UPI0024B683EB|nr:PadR family transcriptional regulator [Rhodococcus sp. IEGM 1409]MDI9898827.1 PadR family transcriptional regulator [Rhodococcus sp. IEGM 1409]
MSLPHALLGLLAVEPRSGYALTEALGNTGIGRHAWHAGHSSIYPELNRLHRLGLIEVTDEGARGKRTYGITGDGHDELRTWLVDAPVTPPVARNEIVLRMFLLSSLDPDDAINILQKIVTHAESEAEEMRLIRHTYPDEIPAGPAGFGHIAAEYGLRADEAVVGWAKWAIGQFERRVSPTDPLPSPPI